MKVNVSHVKDSSITKAINNFASFVTDNTSNIWDPSHPFDDRWKIYDYGLPKVGSYSIVGTATFSSIRVNILNDVLTLGLDVPGIKAEDINIDLEGGKIQISGKSKKTDRYVKEFYLLPAEWDPKSVEAELEDGILTLTVQKLPESKTRKVVVKSR